MVAGFAEIVERKEIFGWGADLNERLFSGGPKPACDLAMN
jgi:hypothetical protein